MDVIIRSREASLIPKREMQWTCYWFSLRCTIQRCVPSASSVCHFIYGGKISLQLLHDNFARVWNRGSRKLILFHTKTTVQPPTQNTPAITSSKFCPWRNFRPQTPVNEPPKSRSNLVPREQSFANDPISFAKSHERSFTWRDRKLIAALYVPRSFSFFAPFSRSEIKFVRQWTQFQIVPRIDLRAKVLDDSYEIGRSDGANKSLVGSASSYCCI